MMYTRTRWPLRVPSPSERERRRSKSPRGATILLITTRCAPKNSLNQNAITVIIIFIVAMVRTARDVVVLGGS